MSARGDLPDVNVWLALSASEHPAHHLAQAYWHHAAGDQLAFSRVTVLGFLRLTTNDVVMGGQPLSAQAAWAAYQAWRQLDNIVLAPEPEGCDALLADWVDQELVLPRLWTDAYLAAVAKAGGWRLVTFDRDFARFDGLDLLLLGG
jgi:hypothetical protein